MLQSYILLLLCTIVLSVPVNDLCENAVTFSSLPFTYSGSTVGSSFENSCDEYDAGDVWFSFTPTESMTVLISLCGPGTNYDTFLYLVSGECSSYECLEVSDDDCDSNSGSALMYNLQAGVRYLTIVSGYSDKVGSYELNVVSSSTHCNNARTITSLPYTISDSIAPGSVSFPCRGNPSRLYYADWFRFTPPIDAGVTFTTCEACSFDSYLWITSGSCQSVLCLDYNDDGCTESFRLSILPTTLTANVQYFLIVTSYSFTTSGTYTLSATYDIPPHNPCTGAKLISSLPFSVISAKFSATPDFSCSSGSVVSNDRDVWYSFTPTSNFPAIVLSTCSSPSMQTIYLASGRCEDLQCIQSDSSSCPYGITSGWIQTSMQARTTYFIAVSSSETLFQLEVFVPPENDQCSEAIQIKRLPFTSSVVSTIYARPDFTCPQNPLRNRDVFFTFTPTEFSYVDVSISLCGSDFDTYVFLASGSCDSLLCLAWNDDSPSCALRSVLDGVTLEQGTTYFIVVSGSNSAAFGSVSLSITGTPRTGCVAATEIPSIPFTFSAETTSAVQPATCRDGGIVGGVAGIFWFTFTPASTIAHVYVTFCSFFDSVL